MIDAHTHIFATVNGINKAGTTCGIGHGRASIGGETLEVAPDLGDETTFPQQVLVATLDAAGVEQAVLLQGPFYGECNACAAEAVRQYPDRFAAQAYLDPWTNGWQTQLTQILATSQFRGIKIEFSEATGLSSIHFGARLDDPHLHTLWTTLQRENHVLTLDLGAVGAASYQTQAVARLASEHPRLPIVICHLAQPSPAVASDTTLLRLWQQQIDLGRLPNVYFDTASLPVYFRHEAYPLTSCGDFIKRAVESVGPEKILWGSDVPGTLTFFSYQQYVELAEYHTDFLPTSQQKQILSENGRHVYFSDSRSVRQ